MITAPYACSKVFIVDGGRSTKQGKQGYREPFTIFTVRSSS